jgi:DNA helicase-2/ATP-dependent DNA helicase PcrA
MMVHKNFEKFKLDYYKPLGSPYRFIDALLQHFSRCKDEVITPEDYLAYADDLALRQGTPDGMPEAERATEIKRIKELAESFHVYQKLLLEQNALDFGDLINYCLKLFRERPNILAHYRKQFKYILVDEFQDTNIAQYELIKLLARPEPTNLHPNGPDSKKLEPIPTIEMSGPRQRVGGSLKLKPESLKLEPNLTVVGDDDQSIYKFRGASSSNILKFKEDYPDCTEITLTLNYRSSQTILDLAYEFIQHNNPDRLEVTLGISKKLINPNFQATNNKSDLSSEVSIETKGETISNDQDTNSQKTNSQNTNNTLQIN